MSPDTTAKLTRSLRGDADPQPLPADGLPGDAPDNDGPPISPLVPESMHRAERDGEAAATSPEFTERPSRGSHTAPAAGMDPYSTTAGAEDDPETR